MGLKSQILLDQITFHKRYEKFFIEENITHHY